MRRLSLALYLHNAKVDRRIKSEKEVIEQILYHIVVEMLRYDRQALCCVYIKGCL